MWKSRKYCVSSISWEESWGVDGPSRALESSQICLVSICFSRQPAEGPAASWSEHLRLFEYGGNKWPWMGLTCILQLSNFSLTKRGRHWSVLKIRKNSKQKNCMNQLTYNRKSGGGVREGEGACNRKRKGGAFFLLQYKMTNIFFTHTHAHYHLPLSLLPLQPLVTSNVFQWYRFKKRLRAGRWLCGYGPLLCNCDLKAIPGTRKHGRREPTLKVVLLPPHVCCHTWTYTDTSCVYTSTK